MEFKDFEGKDAMTIIDQRYKVSNLYIFFLSPISSLKAKLKINFIILSTRPILRFFFEFKSIKQLNQNSNGKK